MKLIKVEKYDLPKYAHMLPESVLHHCKDIFACVDGDTINGIVALEKLDGYMSIALIWVEEDMRRKGIGTALIKCACYCAKEQGSPAVTIVYDPEETYSSVLEYILAKIGFNLLMYPSESYRITDEDIKSSPLMRGVDLDKEYKMHTRALSELSSRELSRLMLVCEERGLQFVSRSDFSKADAEKTRVIVINGELVGIVLITAADFPGEYEMSVMFIDQNHSAMGIHLLRDAAVELLRDPCGFSSLSFTCVSENSNRLATGLLTGGEKSVRHVCEGVLETALLGNERGV